jgi:hypothetical protein
MAEIKYVIGDATEPVSLHSEKENKFIIHIVNDCGVFGAGFVVPLGQKYPRAKEDYLRHGEYFGYQLGKNIYSFCDEVCIVHMIAQKGLRSYNNPVPLDYDALTDCLSNLFRRIARFSFDKISIHGPRFGCGLAGGKWEMIEEIIQETLNEVNVVIYDLPN